MRLLASVALAMTASAAVADEREAVLDCLKTSATMLEPHHENLVDLSTLLVSTQCLSKRSAFLWATNSNNPEGQLAYEKQMLIEVRSALIAARAERFGIELE